MANRVEGQCASSDILFPEDSPHEARPEVIYSPQSEPPPIYSPPSNYSTYSQENKYLFKDPKRQGKENITPREPPPKYGSHYRHTTRDNGTTNSVLAARSRSQSIDALPTYHSTPRASVNSQRSNNSAHSTKSYSETDRQPNHPQSHRDLKYIQPKVAYRTNSTNNKQHQSKRRTWSPQDLSTMGIASSFHSNGYTLRSCRSNDQLDGDNGHLYEDLNFVRNMPHQPPRIAPVSGILAHDAGKCLVRPIAFKPIATQNRYVSPTQHISEKIKKCDATDQNQNMTSGELPYGIAKKHKPMVLQKHMKDGGSRQSSHDEGYISQEYQSTNLSTGLPNCPGSQALYNGSIHSYSESTPSYNGSTNSCPDEGGTPSQNGFNRYSERRVSFNKENCHTVRPLPERPESMNSSSIGRVSSNRIEEFTVEQTPSPSDSGVGEMEVVLREKDAEIINLRETMDHNEKVIFQVYEEKQQTWQMEMAEVKEEYQKKIRSFQQRMNKMEQSFMLQIFKLQQEKKVLTTEKDSENSAKLTAEAKLNEAESRLNEVMSLQDESKWEVHHKSGEIGLLKKQMKDTKEEVGVKTNEVLTLRAQIRDLHGQVEESNHKVAKLQTDLTESRIALHKAQTEMTEIKTRQALCGSGNNNNYAIVHHTATTACQTDDTSVHATSGATPKTNTSDQLKAELDAAHKELTSLHQKMRDEKQRWFDEKDKVVRYQKQLQLNYVQMFRKNRMLEAEIEQLTVELESRDIKLITAPDESLC